MRGVNAESGRRLSGREHLRQSVRDILTTPIGSRVMRRDYGSRLFALIDRPLNAGAKAAFVAATADALDRWEPRYRLRSVAVSAGQDGQILLDLVGDYVPDGTTLEVQGIEV